MRAAARKDVQHRQRGWKAQQVDQATRECREGFIGLINYISQAGIKPGPLAPILGEKK
jgi:hypothetical protein